MSSLSASTPLTVANLLDVVIATGDSPALREDQQLFEFLQNKADELFKLPQSQPLSESDQTFFGEVQRLCSEGNKVSTFVRTRLLGTERNLQSTASFFTTEVNSQEVSGAGEILTPLAVAARQGDCVTIRNLISQGARVDAKCTVHISKEEYYPYWFSCEPELEKRKKASVTDHLIEEWTPLMCAVYANQLEAARELIDKGADVNSRDAKRLTVLMLAAAKGATEIVQLLLDCGAVVNAGGLAVLGRDLSNHDWDDPMPDSILCSVRWTALHGAVRLLHLETAKLLLDRGADINADTIFGHVPLMYAIGHLELFALLFSYNPDLMRSDYTNRMWELMSIYPKFSLLRDEGDLLEGEEERNLTVPLVIEEFRKMRTRFHRINGDHKVLQAYAEESYTVLMKYRHQICGKHFLYYAVQTDRLVEAQWLLARISKENPSLTSEIATSCIFAAIARALSSNGEIKERALAMMHLLFYYGADPNGTYCKPSPVFPGTQSIHDHPDRLKEDAIRTDRTYLMHAAVLGDLEVMRLLLQNKADVNLTSYDLRLSRPKDRLFIKKGNELIPSTVVQFKANVFWLASQYAPSTVKREILQLLLKHGASRKAPDFTAIPDYASGEIRKK